MAPDAIGKIQGGFILLARKAEKTFRGKPDLWLKLWVWMLFRARFKDGNKLKRGQFITTIEEMRDAMSYYVGYRKQRPTKDQIRSAYEAFAKSAMITTAKTTRGMIITILNYEYYQDTKNYESHSEDHNEDSTKTTMTPHDRERRGKEGGNNTYVGTGAPTNVCPYEKIKSMYHEILPELPRVKIMSKKRMGYLKARWTSGIKSNAGLSADTLEFWEGFFGHIRKSKFLMGQAPSQNGRSPFMADFEWIITESNFLKILEGKYHR